MVPSQRRAKSIEQVNRTLEYKRIMRRYQPKEKAGISFFLSGLPSLSAQLNGDKHRMEHGAQHIFDENMN